jgi:hypothetical protein
MPLSRQLLHPIHLVFFSPFPSCKPNQRGFSTTVSHRPQIIVKPSIPAAPHQNKVTIGSASLSLFLWWPQFEQGALYNDANAPVLSQHRQRKPSIPATASSPRLLRPRHRVHGELARLLILSTLSLASSIVFPSVISSFRRRSSPPAILRRLPKYATTFSWTAPARRTWCTHPLFLGSPASAALVYPR